MNAYSGLANNCSKEEFMDKVYEVMGDIKKVLFNKQIEDYDYIYDDVCDIVTMQLYRLLNIRIKEIGIVSNTEKYITLYYDSVKNGINRCNIIINKENSDILVQYNTLENDEIITHNTVYKMIDGKVVKEAIDPEIIRISEEEFTNVTRVLIRERMRK